MLLGIASVAGTDANHELYCHPSTLPPHRCRPNETLPDAEERFLAWWGITKCILLATLTLNPNPNPNPNTLGKVDLRQLHSARNPNPEPEPEPDP
jgi:hypothetical protein